MKVRDLIRVIEKDGWFLVRIKGSHHQFKHPTKNGLVTVPGKRSDELAPGTLNNILKQAYKAMKKYLIIFEKTATGYSAYSPDLPGCGSTGVTREEVEKNIREAIGFHIEGLKQEGFEVPEPTTYSSYIDVAA